MNVDERVGGNLNKLNIELIIKGNLICLNLYEHILIKGPLKKDCYYFVDL